MEGLHPFLFGQLPTGLTIVRITTVRARSAPLALLLATTPLPLAFLALLITIARLFAQFLLLLGRGLLLLGRGGGSCGGGLFVVGVIRVEQAGSLIFRLGICLGPGVQDIVGVGV